MSQRALRFSFIRSLSEETKDQVATRDGPESLESLDLQLVRTLLTLEECHWRLSQWHKTLRPCIDVRGLNEITIKNRYPLPLIDPSFEPLNQATIFYQARSAKCKPFGAYLRGGQVENHF